VASVSASGVEWKANTKVARVHAAGVAQIDMKPLVDLHMSDDTCI